MPRLLQPMAMRSPGLILAATSGFLNCSAMVSGDVVHARRPDVLPDRHHAGQGNVQAAGDIDVDAIDHGVGSFVFE